MSSIATRFPLSRLVITGALLSLVPAAHAQLDCATWAGYGTAGQPAGASADVPVVAYDSLRAKTVLVDRTGLGFEWNGSSWSPIPPVPLAWGGSARAAMSYDPTRGMSVVTWADKTWEFNGGTWIPKLNTPSPRVNHSMVWDGERTLCIGGNVSGSLTMSIMAWNGVSWGQIAAGGTVPPARQHFGAAYDSTRHVLVVFGGGTLGGGNLNDTWEFNGTSWVNRTNLGLPTPSPRQRHSLTYDAERNVCLLHGGIDTSPLHDTWEWDGNVWTLRAPTPSQNQSDHAATYDSLRKLVSVYGGAGPSSFTRDFVLSPPQISIAQHPQSQAVAQGQPVQFSVLVVGPSFAHYQWRQNGVPIPGAIQSILTIVSVDGKASGAYDCVVSDGPSFPYICGAVTTAPATLTVTGPLCQVDLNGDGTVNGTDLAMLLAAWGPGACQP